MRRGKRINTSINPPADRHSWPWYKVWAMSLFRPRVSTGEILLSEGCLSLRQAILWLAVASLICMSLTRLAFPVVNLGVTTWQTAITQIVNVLISALEFSLGIFIFCGVVHGIAKLFGRKGTLRDFFLVYVAFVAPVLVILGISLYIGFGIKASILILLPAFIELYWLSIINTITIKSVYHFSWPGTCSISFLIALGCSIIVLLDLYYHVSHPH